MATNAAIPAEQTAITAGENGQEPTPVGLGWALVAIAAALMFAGGAVRASRPFDGDHAWVSAHFSVMARNFAEEGVVALRAVPMQNNPLRGTEADVYIHWPPLFPILLGEGFRMAGESETVARLLLLLNLAATTLAIYALAAACSGHRSGLIAAYAWLVTPIVAVFAREIFHLNLAILFLLVAVFGFIKATGGDTIDRRWAALGLAAMLLATLTSWEPLLAGPGLLLVSWARGNRNQRRLASAFILAGVIAAAAVLFDYLAAYPAHAEQLRRTVLYRAGLVYEQPARMPFHALPDQRWYRDSSVQLMWTQVARTLVSRMASGLGRTALAALIAAVVLLGIGRNRPNNAKSCLAMAGLLTPGLLWAVGMSNHMFIHNYEMLLFAPAAALAVSLVYATLDRRFADLRKTWRVLAIAALAALMIVPLAADTWERLVTPSPEDWLIPYAKAIDTATGPDAVVLATSPSMVPVYYSRRHIIRFVNNDLALTEVASSMAGVFPGHPIYLAIPPRDAAYFPVALSRYPIQTENTELILLDVSRATETSAQK